MVTDKNLEVELQGAALAGFAVGSTNYTPVYPQIAKVTRSTSESETYIIRRSQAWPGNSQPLGRPLRNAGTDPRTGKVIVGGIQNPEMAQPQTTRFDAIEVHNSDWNMPLPIKFNALEDGKGVTNQIQDWATESGQNYQKHIDYLVFALLNSGTTDTYGVCVDGLPLFSASHTYQYGRYTAAQSNTGSALLTVANANSSRARGSRFLDDNGVPVIRNHTMLLHSSLLTYEAAQVVGNANVAGTANNDINPLFGSLRNMSVPGTWFDDDRWMLLDISDESRRPVLVQIRLEPELYYDDDNVNFIRTYSWRARYDVAPYDWTAAIRGA